MNEKNNYHANTQYRLHNPVSLAHNTNIDYITSVTYITALMM